MMFGSGLKKENEELRKRVEALESAAFAKIGPYAPELSHVYGALYGSMPIYTDNRKQVTAAQAIEMILAHLGLQITSTPAIEEQIELVKISRGRK